MIKKIELSWITVSDIQKAKKFFVDTLGMQLTSNSSEYQWLEVQGNEGGMLLGIGQCNEEYGTKPGHNAVVTMTVENIESAKKSLEEKGVIFEGEILEIPGHVKMVTFLDADNNRFQLVQTVYKA